MIDTRPKMLLFSHLSSSGFVTGAEKLLLLFARLMAERYQCVLVAPREGIITTIARQMGMPVILFDIPLCMAFYVASPYVRGHVDQLKSQFVYQQLLSLLVRERPEIVFTNTCVHPLPAMAAKSLGIPAVWSLMEWIQPAPQRRLALDMMADACDVIAGISATTIEPFRGHRGESKTHILSPYVALDELDPPSWPLHRALLRQQYGWSEQECVIGFIAGTIYRQKGLESFIHAARLMHDPQLRLRFLIVGNSIDEEYMQSCLSLVRASGMEGRFEWIRFAERIEHVYPAMDIVVVPSLQAEGFGMTALEGLYFGKPVVAYASGGLVEIMQATGNERFLAPTGNVKELAGKLEELAADEELRRYTGERNIHAASAAYSADTLRAQLDGLAARLPYPLQFVSPLIRSHRKTVYLVENGLRRPFVSEKAFLQRGFRFEDVRIVTPAQLQQYKLGQPIVEWPEQRATPVAAPTGRRGRRRKRRRSAGRQNARVAAAAGRGIRRARRGSRSRTGARRGRLRLRRTRASTRRRSVGRRRVRRRSAG